jgi:DNA-binding GntR family transcriptional regulator
MVCLLAYSSYANKLKPDRIMRRRQISAAEIRHTLLHRINSGQYALGSRIPPVRTLAAEFGAHRNTVNKAFQELARDGIVTLVPGRGGGTFVQRADTGDGSALERLRADLRALAQQGRAMGISRTYIQELAISAFDDVYQAHPLRLKFLECNVHDAATLVDQLVPVVEYPIESGVIEQEDLAALGACYDLVITTFHHLAEVRRGLGPLREKVIGVNAVPTHEVALKIARLEARHLGLVCGRENTVQSMKYLVASYHPDDDLDVALIDDAAAVSALVRKSEALIVTYSCADTFARLTQRTPDVVVEFQIERQSIEYLRQRIERLQAEHTAQSPASNPV